MPPIPFLRTVATEILHNFGTKLPDTAIILPTKRACLYFRHFLTEVAPATLLSPEIISMEDFIRQIAEVQVPDNVKLLFQLYETFKRFDQNQDHDLEKFIPLGSVILKDFDLIDRNMVNGNDLFAYLDQAKALERWGEELGKEINIGENSTISNYYLFWKYLKETYHVFRAELLAENLAYSGLAYRHVAENIDTVLDKNEIQQAVFVGFNLLSTSELTIMQKLDSRKKASFYFDSDLYYLNNHLHEAGFYLRKYKDWLAERFKIEQNFIGTEQKKITIYSVSNKVTQAKLAGDLLSKQITQTAENQEVENFKTAINHTAILLPDETMLQPLLHSLPVQTAFIEKTGVSVKELLNVTMGLSIDKTPLFHLIDNLFTLQENFHPNELGETLIYYKDVIKLLRHSYIQYSKNYKTDYELIQNNIEKIQKNNQVFVRLDELLEYGKTTKFYKVLFRNWNGNIRTALDSFHELIEALSELFDNEYNVFERECLFKFYTVVVELEDALENYYHVLTINTFKHFLYEVLRSQDIPFTGEPLAPIQVMGMLESRTLDFENIIILSCNEGILPKGKTHNSVIPFDIRLSFGLPTHVENDATFAYTFYRLFHRAKNISLIYSTSQGDDSNGASEKSRFLTQIQAEMRYLPNLEIEEKQVLMSLPDKAALPLSVPKDEAILERVQMYLAVQGITPSYFNMYIGSPLEFFERKILNLSDPEEVEEHMMVNTFGTVVHSFLEKSLEKMIGKNVQKADLEAIIKDDKSIDEAITEAIRSEKKGIVVEQGKNFILKHVAHYLIKTFLSLQAQKEAPFYLISQEKRMEVILEMDNFFGKKIKVKIAGKTDRIDIFDGKIRIIDYKTGTYNTSDLKVKTFEDLLLLPEKGRVVQLLVYKYLFLKNLLEGKIKNVPPNWAIKEIESNHKIVQSGFYFFRKLEDGFKEFILEDEPADTQGFMSYVENFMRMIIQDLLDPARPFSQEPSDFGLEKIGISEHIEEEFEME